MLSFRVELGKSIGMRQTNLLVQKIAPNINQMLIAREKKLISSCGSTK